MVVLNAIDIDATFICNNFFVEPKSFPSFQTGKKHTIHSKLSCDSKNVIFFYLLQEMPFSICGTTTDFIRFRSGAQAPNNSEKIDRLLITKEAYWSAQLFSLAPYGLNKRKEFHSNNRICYN